MAAQVEVIVKNAGKGSTSVYERVLKAHDILCANIRYVNDGAWDRHTAVGALIDRQAVCDGYAKAFKMVMDRMGIPCLVVLGKGNPRQNSKDPDHAWNLVQLNGMWRHIDLAFDSSDDWRRERIRDYFSLTDRQIRKDHAFDSTRYPEASGSNSDYYTSQGLIMRGKRELRELAVANVRHGIREFSVKLPDHLPDNIVEPKVTEVLTRLPLGNGVKYRVNLGCNREQHIFRIRFELATV